ncbi:MAG TPA: M14 family zinc carboxypeptidase [Gemmatimonadales bacterium]|nr:M14 family zinc carboxypeptidase [Gemmatimonadales bacterium]
MVLAAVVTVAGLALQSPQAIDSAYTAKIRELTTEPRFNTELTDHLPADARVPTPFKVLGYVPGTVGKLSYVADITRYFRALDEASPRVKVFDLGPSDEGRPMIIAAIADSATIERLEQYRAITAALADPRGLSSDSAQRLIAAGKPIYYASGSIHSPETGSPEMLMELAYRLAVEDTPFIRQIRDSIITLITPVTEVDGRDRQVDIYRYRKANKNIGPNLVYWGKYTAHDNNRDGIVMSQVLTRRMMKAFFDWHPTVLHDLHESVPFLYTSTGTGPYNRELDPIVITEWHELAFQEITELTKRGLPGVWTHDFYDGWTPNYMFWVANGHNSIGRFYETYTSRGADCHTVQLPASRTSVQWFRPNPPINGVRWCIRNNINYQQSALLIALNYMARNGHRYLDQFYRKGVRAIERGRVKDGPNAFQIPANQARPVEAANLVNLLRFHGLDVHRASRAFKAGGGDVAAGDYIVRLDQPYGPLAKSYFSRQDYGADDPRPYDDTGWTLQYVRNVALRPITDTAVLHAPLTLMTNDAKVTGSVSGAKGAGAYLIAPTTESGLIQFRLALNDVRMFASEDTFNMDGRQWGRGTTIIELNAVRDVNRLTQAAESLGLSVVGVRATPRVARHELDLPKIALVHSWLNTQNEGWVRYAFDVLGVPYTYMNVQQLKDRELLKRFNVIVFPYVSNNAQAIVNGQPMNGPPIPWRRTPETPNLGGLDSTDDVRPGIGLEGLTALSQWVAAGGVLITEGGTSGVFTDFGVTRGVDIVPARQLRASGGIYRAVLKDARSPIAYGYPDTLAVYFNQIPLFQVDTSTEVPEDQDPDLTAAQARARPRVVMSFHQKRDSLRLSGLLVNGEELAGRPAVLDAPVGQGHIVLFAIRPFWRWETQGSFALVFNTILNWNDLAVSWPAGPKPSTRAVAAPSEGP